MDFDHNNRTFVKSNTMRRERKITHTHILTKLQQQFASNGKLYAIPSIHSFRIIFFTFLLVTMKSQWFEQQKREKIVCSHTHISNTRAKVFHCPFVYFTYLSLATVISSSLSSSFTSSVIGMNQQSNEQTTTIEDNCHCTRAYMNFAAHTEKSNAMERQ